MAELEDVDDMDDLQEAFEALITDDTQPNSNNPDSTTYLTTCGTVNTEEAQQMVDILANQTFKHALTNTTAYRIDQSEQPSTYLT